MTYKELIDRISRETGRHRQDVLEIVDVVAEVLADDANQESVDTFEHLYMEGFRRFMAAKGVELPPEVSKETADEIAGKYR